MEDKVEVGEFDPSRALSCTTGAGAEFRSDQAIPAERVSVRIVGADCGFTSSADHGHSGDH